MGRPRLLRSVLGLVIALGLVAPAVAEPRVATAAGPEFPAWTGGVDLYRDGSFTTQKTWSWCTAAGLQIVRNIVEGDADHTTEGQHEYFDWMRERNRYALPEAAGVDPAGWTAGLRHFVDDRYRLVASRTFDGALRSAVERMRLTNLPVALTVAHGGHGWILTGFRATADPATTEDYRVTSVRVVGPLHGRQRRNGYDMPPNTKLTPTQLRRYFTPWRYDPKPMIWDGLYVSIQPVPKSATAASTATATPSARPSATATPSARPSATASGPLIAAVITSPGVASPLAPPAPAGMEPVADAAVPSVVWLLLGSLVLVALLAGRLRARKRRA